MFESIKQLFSRLPQIKRDLSDSQSRTAVTAPPNIFSNKTLVYC